MSKRNELTFEEKITVAYMYFVRGKFHQDDLATIYNINPGRISEAITAIEHAAKNSQTSKYRYHARKRRKAAKKKVKR